MMKPVLRPMRGDDLEAALVLVEQFEPTLIDEARETFQADLDNTDAWPLERYRMVAELDGAVVGTMGYGPGGTPSDGIRWTDWLMVDTRLRRQGIASQIYLELERILREAGCRKVYLDVGTVYKQPDAIAFHASHGYRIEGILQDYWGEGDDLVVMAKTL